MNRESQLCASFLHVQSLPLGRKSGDDCRPFELGFDLEVGGKVTITGGVGTGKSDAACLIAGLSYNESTLVCMNGQSLQVLSSYDRARTIALLPSNPILLYSSMTSTLESELYLTLQVLGYETSESDVNAIIETFGLKHLLSRNPFTLSGGERVRAALAITLLKHPRLLVIDNTLYALDDNARDEVSNLLDAYCETFGAGVVIFQDKLSCFSQARNSFLITESGIIDSPTSASHSSTGIASSAGCESRHSERPAPVAAIEIQDLSFSYRDNTAFHLGPISCSLMRGEIAFIKGKNGAGKTTFLKCLANINRGWQGQIHVYPNPPRAKDPLFIWARSVLYSFQDPDDQIYLSTVNEELRETARRTRGEINEAHYLHLIEAFDLIRWLQRSPLDLPRPYRRIITLVSAFLARPPVLLLDEPTAFLDEDLCLKVTNAVKEFLENGGAIVAISHDSFWMQHFDHSTITIKDGRLDKENLGK